MSKAKEKKVKVSSGPKKITNMVEVPKSLGILAKNRGHQ